MKDSEAGSTRLVWEQQEGQHGWGECVEVTKLPPVLASYIQLQHHQEPNIIMWRLW